MTGNTLLANANVDERIRQCLFAHHAGGPVIDRYTKVTTDTEQEIREAVAVFDTIRASKENVTSIRVRRRRTA